MAKAKKSKAKKSKVKKAKAAPVKKKKKAAKAVKAQPSAKKAPAKKTKAPAKKSKKIAPKKAVKKAAPKKKKQIVGEGDYAASRKFDKDQAAFVKKNKAKIPELGKEAEAALDGPEGDSLRAAEQEAMNRSVIE